MSEARHVVNAQLLTIFLDAPRFDQGRIYLLKVNNINIGQSVKYVQS